MFYQNMKNGGKKFRMNNCNHKNRGMGLHDLFYLRMSTTSDNMVKRLTFKPYGLLFRQEGYASLFCVLNER